MLLLAPLPIIAQDAALADPCIEEHWPWTETIPASVEEMLDQVAVIRSECSPTKTMYAQRKANVRREPSTSSPRVGTLAWGEEVAAICGIEGDEWSGSKEWCDTGDGYVHTLLLGDSTPVARPRPPVPAAESETTVVAQQPAQVDVCSGYTHCVQVCTYKKHSEFWFAADGIGASNVWKGVPDCLGSGSGFERGSGKIWWSPCGRGQGQFDTIWANNGMYLRWRCPG